MEVAAPHNTNDNIAIADSPDRFINRELSWLAFNNRVLEEAFNHHHPLLERLRFLSISGSNLDEFYMVRVAGLKEQIRNKAPSQSKDGLGPDQQLRLISENAVRLMEMQQKCWLELVDELKSQRIFVAKTTDISSDEKEWLHTHFSEEIFPALSPLAIDPAHPFPFLPNMGIALVMHLEKSIGGRHLNAIIPLPASLRRFIRLPGEDQRFVMIDDVIQMFMDMLFPKYSIVTSGLVRVIRDSEVDIAEEAEDLVRQFERAVKRRRRGVVIRLKINHAMPQSLRRFVLNQLQVSEEDVIPTDGLVGISSTSELYDSIDRPDLKFKPFTPRFPERIHDYRGDCFAAIEAKDILVHHPYESFDVVVQFLRQAAVDPHVVAIKQTLYRTNEQSPIVAALIEAAENGKSVTALVELKARFDEEANIRWARNLERAGVQVVYGFINYKTHAKISLVIRRENGRLNAYAHFGTGNYNQQTARVYTDLSLFSSDEKGLCRDAGLLFNYLTGYAKPRNLSKLLVAPLNMREKFLELIDAEINHAQAGKPGHIWLKMNALVDEQIIDRLYLASRSGVKIECVVRGVCCLRPGIPGFSDNITVKSMIGRFLEHSRIYCFGNGRKLPHPEAKVYLASADLMMRSLNRRVEVMVPIENPTVHEQILGQIMAANLRDAKQSWVLNPDGTYTRIKFNEASFCAHDYFMHNPSLSGRGKAAEQIKPPRKRK